jgi:hypothetical protein
VKQDVMLLLLLLLLHATFCLCLAGLLLGLLNSCPPANTLTTLLAIL